MLCAPARAKWPNLSRARSTYRYQSAASRRRFAFGVTIPVGKLLIAQRCQRLTDRCVVRGCAEHAECGGPACLLGCLCVSNIIDCDQSNAGSTGARDHDLLATLGRANGLRKPVLRLADVKPQSYLPKLAWPSERVKLQRPPGFPRGRPRVSTMGGLTGPRGRDGAPRAASVGAGGGVRGGGPPFATV